jgi:hypothetical protein
LSPSGCLDKHQPSTYSETYYIYYIHMLITAASIWRVP